MTDLLIFDTTAIHGKDRAARLTCAKVVWSLLRPIRSLYNSFEDSRRIELKCWKSYYLKPFAKTLTAWQIFGQFLNERIPTPHLFVDFNDFSILELNFQTNAIYRKK